MDQNEDRLPAIVEYLRANPMKTVEEGSTHYHIHLPPPPPPPPPPKPTVAEQVVPWLYFGLMATIIGTVCAMILAAVILALVVGLLTVAVVAAVLAYLIKTTRESQINTELAAKIPSPPRRTR